jgi:hypothetical protein
LATRAESRRCDRDLRRRDLISGEAIVIFGEVVVISGDAIVISGDAIVISGDAISSLATRS